VVLDFGGLNKGLIDFTSQFTARLLFVENQLRPSIWMVMEDVDSMDPTFAICLSGKIEPPVGSTLSFTQMNGCLDALAGVPLHTIEIKTLVKVIQSIANFTRGLHGVIFRCVVVPYKQWSSRIDNFFDQAGSHTLIIRQVFEHEDTGQIILL
jgi:hypothetical protein